MAAPMAGVTIRASLLFRALGLPCHRIISHAVIPQDYDVQQTLSIKEMCFFLGHRPPYRHITASEMDLWVPLMTWDPWTVAQPLAGISSLFLLKNPK